MRVKLSFDYALTIMQDPSETEKYTKTIEPRQNETDSKVTSSDRVESGVETS